MARPKRTPKAPRRTMKVHSGDQVQVISGKDRGKTGRVLRVEPAKERVYVEHLNMIKRHTRPQQVAGAQSEQQMGGDPVGRRIVGRQQASRHRIRFHVESEARHHHGELAGLLCP